MKTSFDKIKAALTAAFKAVGVESAQVHLMPIEPPRKWGVTSNACFRLGKQLVADEIASATEGLSKKEAKQVSSKLAKAAGEELATKIASELNSLISSSRAGVPARQSIEALKEDFRAYSHRLPHWRLSGSVYFVTWRIHPGQSKLDEAERDLVAQAIEHFNGDRYGILAYVVMDDHVHVLVKPNSGFELTDILHSWKSYTANQMQREFSRKGSIWQNEYFDRIVRGEEELKEKAEYIIGNPVKRWSDVINYKWLYIDMAGRDARPTTDSEPPQNSLPFISTIEAEGAYLNFYYDVPALTGQVVSTVLEQASEYGKGEDTGKRIMVEFAQPNTHKDFHIGHLRNAAIGQAIANLLEFAGNDVLKATYLGDVGAHVAKAIWGEGQSKKDPPKAQGFFTSLPNEEAGALEYWGAIYKDATAWLAWLEKHHGDEAAIAKGRMSGWLKRWELGDTHTRERWQSSRRACIEGFKQIFDELLLEFSDGCWFYESEIEDKKLGQQTAKELAEQGLAQIDDSLEYKGALFVDLAKETGNKRLGKMTVLRSDGTSLYQTKELGLAKLKFEEFDIDESLYVVGAEQKFYFEQVTSILKLWGFPNADKCRHVTYELVVLPEGKMSSREGNIVSYRELRNQAVETATALTSEKGISGDIAETSNRVAIASIKYAMLSVTANQKIVFDLERALSFQGRSAPYLQYAYARAGKLAGGSGAGKVLSQPGYELHPSEVSLARILWAFPDSIAEAANQTEPSTICSYLYELASAFSDFYRDCRVLDAPELEKEFRMQMCQAFRQVIRTGFKVLALPLPEEM